MKSVKESIPMKKKKKDFTTKIETTKVQIREYNNKSRKGLYIYIKTPKKQSRIYKYTGQTGEIEAIKQYYTDKYITKRPYATSIKKYKTSYTKQAQGDKIKKPSRIDINTKRYLNKIKKQRPIESIINAGTAKTTIQNAHKKQPSQVKAEIKKLLSQLVLDPQLVDIMSQDQNLEKIKHRFQYNLKVYNEKGEVLLESTKYNEQPTRVIQQIRQSVNEGELISEGYKGSTSSKLQSNKWIQHQSQAKRTGRVYNTQLEIILRR